MWRIQASAWKVREEYVWISLTHAGQTFSFIFVSLHA